MKNAVFSTVLFLIVSLSFSQNKIDNKLTDTHQSIKGTKLNLIAPSGFTVATNFLGFQDDESGSSVMIMDIPGPYSLTSKGISKESMSTKGVEVSNIENLTINGLPAMFLTGTQNAYGNLYGKYVFVFGSEKETILINGAFPSKFQKIGDDIKKSMLSVVYQTDKITDPLDALDYKLNVSGTKLKFAKSMSGSLIFTVDGQVPSASADKTSLVVAKSFSAIEQKDKKTFATNRIEQLPMVVETIDQINEITIDGLLGYEIFATEKSEKGDVPGSVYQVILYSDNLYYIFLGTTSDTTPASIEQIKTAVSTFKRK